jgi:DNA (cytosine-5)-methyltransferase 1
MVIGPLHRIYSHELIVDSFAGGGGASTGIEMALGRSPDVAINHDAAAIAMHMANHPRTHHLLGNVWDADPLLITRGKPVGLLWGSPDCTHFSRCKQGKPLSKKVRALAWSLSRWAACSTPPRVIACENVGELKSWGPLLPSGQPDSKRAGQTFRAWIRRFQKHGYHVEWRELAACDYGAPTSRRRLFVIARRDGVPIMWPEATHGQGLEPYRTAAEIIDFATPTRSIFERDEPLVEKTLARIVRGVRKYVLNAPRPFVLPVDGDGMIAVPTLIQKGYGERPGQAPRVPGLERPIGTIVAGGVKHTLVVAFLALHYGGNYRGAGVPLTSPLSTITTIDHHALVTATVAHPGSTRGHADEVRALLRRFPDESVDDGAQRSLFETGSRDDGLVRIGGRVYEIVDIGARPLTPRELFRGQGFPESYIVDPIVNGKPLSPSQQVHKCGNSVPPPVAAALVRANLGGALEMAA